jgi:hypothetical protein
MHLTLHILIRELPPAFFQRPGSCGRPRLGFNWDVFGNKTTQVRGGSGLFTGRVPFVWISNQFSNNGELNGTYSVGSSSSSATPITNPAGLNLIRILILRNLQKI